MCARVCEGVCVAIQTMMGENEALGNGDSHIKTVFHSGEGSDVTANCTRLSLPQQPPPPPAHVITPL